MTMMTVPVTTSLPNTVENDLRKEVYRLQERVRELERALLSDYIPPFPMPRMELVVLQCLMQHKLCTKLRLNAALYHRNRTAADDVVHSHISKLRRKLKVYGVVIQQSRYIGYWISDEDKKKVYAITEDTPTLTAQVSHTC